MHICECLCEYVICVQVSTEVRGLRFSVAGVTGVLSHLTLVLGTEHLSSGRVT